MAKQRTDRLNSLLKEVISEVLRKDVHNPDINEFVTITHVDITRDLRHAKVHVSVIGSEQVKAQTVDAMQSAAGYISVIASKKVVMRFFPALTFILDDSVEKQMRIEKLLGKIHTEENARIQQNTQSEETE